MTEQVSSRPLALKMATSLAAAAFLLWAGWITREVLTDESPRIVTVRLAETIGQFIDEAARADAEPAAVQAASLAYLQAAEKAVADMGKDGRVVLVAEAVLAGASEDATPELKVRIAAKLETAAQP